MDDIKLSAKNEKELETLIHTVRIYSQDKGMEFGIEKCPVQVMKSGKRHIANGMELPNQDKIIMLGEKETYIYLGILKLTLSNQWKLKKKLKKNISEEPESYSRQNYVAETLSNKYVGCIPRKILGNILKQRIT